MAGTNIADTLVEYLSSRGVENIFGVLAHTSFAIGDAIAKQPHMRFVNAQHEGGAGNMALGYARATKKPAVCLVSAGGGATNIVTAVAQAYKESVPLFVISSDIGTAASAKGAWSSFHGMEHVRLFQPITKQSVKLERVEELGSILDSLFRQTTRGRQGPVFLIIPEDLQHANLPEPLSFAPTAEPVAPAMDAAAAQASPWISCSKRKLRWCSPAPASTGPAPAKKCASLPSYYRCRLRRATQPKAYFRRIIRSHLAALASAAVLTRANFFKSPI